MTTKERTDIIERIRYQVHLHGNKGVLEYKGYVIQSYNLSSLMPLCDAELKQLCTDMETEFGE